MSSYHCYACRQPVSGLATRCPHCTSALGFSGSRDRSQDYSHLPPIYISPEAQAEAEATALVFTLKLAVIVGLVWWFWSDIVMIVEWLRDTYQWARTWLHGVLVWLFG
jgi:hypothetical protein